MRANCNPLLGESLLDRAWLNLGLLGDSVHGEGHGISIKCLDHRQAASRGKAEGPGNRGSYNFRHSTISVSGARGPGTEIGVSHTGTRQRTSGGRHGQHHRADHPENPKIC